jgi:hypothetical protein
MLKRFFAGHGPAPLGGMRVVLTAFCALALVYFILGSRHPANPPGPAAPSEPIQGPTAPIVLQKNGYTITTLARYQIEALVISTERYWIDGGASLSPIDFAVCWGPMSDDSIVDQFSFSQGHRWFSYRHYGNKPMPLAEDVLNSHCANMHMVPADSHVEKQLKSVSARDVVDMSGYLVEITGPNRFKWTSSLTRTDTGAGACELMWVQELTKRP